MPCKWLAIFAWLGRPRKKAAPSPVGEVKIVSPISTFVLKTLTLKESAFFFVSSGAVDIALYKYVFLKNTEDANSILIFDT